MSEFKANRLNGEYIDEHRDAHSGMNAVIIYDQCDLALKANAMLEHAALSIDEFQWDIRPWRMQFILSPASGDLPLVDAAEAHLIVLAIRHQTDLSPQLLNWLETWAECRSVEDAGVAVFDGRNGDMLATPMARHLANFANRHGLFLLAGEECPPIVNGRLAPLPA